MGQKICNFKQAHERKAEEYNCMLLIIVLAMVLIIGVKLIDANR
jgi:hypothetical protein